MYTHKFFNLKYVARLVCVIPQSVREDDRVTPIMSELMQNVNSQMDGGTVDVINMPGPDIDINVGLPIILPCIAASRVGSDISAALTKARIGTFVFKHNSMHLRLHVKVSTFFFLNM